MSEISDSGLRVIKTGSSWDVVEFDLELEKMIGTRKQIPVHEYSSCSLEEYLTNPKIEWKLDNE